MNNIKIDKVQISGLSRVIDFRRSFDSQAGSDSVVSFSTQCTDRGYTSVETVVLGPKDVKRLSSLVDLGDSHAKSMRFVDVTIDLTLPRRVWVDFDTYRLGRKDVPPLEIEYFSDSTMHTLHKGVTSEDFDTYTDMDSIAKVNAYAEKYRSDPTEDNFLSMKSNLPEGMLQCRSTKMNYQTLRHIYHDRKNHKQPEFKVFCQWIETLPFADKFITK